MDNNLYDGVMGKKNKQMAKQPLEDREMQRKSLNSAVKAVSSRAP